MNLFKLLKICIVLKIIILLIACGGSDDISDESSYLLKSTSTSEELTKEYENVPGNSLIKVDFTDNLSYTTIKQDVKYSDRVENVSSLSDYIEIQNRNLFNLKLGDKVVDGSLYISSNKKSLIYIPNAFLKPDSEYTAMLTKQIKSSNGKRLENNLIFKVKTNSKQNFASLVAPDTVEESENIDMSLKSEINLKQIKWDLNIDSINDEIVENVDEITYSYKNSGIYNVKVILTDNYGRKFFVLKKINVLKNPEQFLSSFNNLEINNIKSISIDDLNEGCLKSSLKDIDKYVKSMAFSTHNMNNVNNTIDFLSFTILPGEIYQFEENLIKNLIDSGKFLGIVSLSGFPAILYFEESDNKSYILKILTTDYGINLKKFSYKGYSFNIDILPISDTPIFHNTSFEIDNVTFLNLRNYLPEFYTGILPVLTIDNNNLTLITYDSDNINVKFGIPSPSDIYNGVKHVVNNATSDIKNTVKHITDFISQDTVNLLKNTKNLLEEFFKYNPLTILNKFKDTGNNISSDLTKLNYKFSNPTTKINVKTIQEENIDINKLITDFNKIMDSDTGTSVKQFIDNTMSEMQNGKDYLNYVIDSFNNYKNNFFGYINNALGSSSESQSIYIFRHNNEGAINIKFGSTTKTLSLSTIINLNSFSGVLSTLGNDFPITQIYDGIKFITNNFVQESMVGYFYNANEKEVDYLAKIGSYDTSKCEEDNNNLLCLGHYLSENELKSEIRIKNDNTGLLVAFSPFRIDQNTYEEANNENNDVFKLLDVLSLACEAFPDLSFIIDVGYQGKTLEIGGDISPNLFFLTAVELGIGVDYAYYGGGNFAADMGLAVGVDLVGIAKAGKNVGYVVGKLEQIVNDAYKNSLGAVEAQVLQMNGIDHNKINKLLFETEGDLINFLKTFTTEIKSLVHSNEFDAITDHIKFRIEGGDTLGVELGEGGTGSGGGAISAKFGANFELQLDLTAFIQFISALGDFDINVFLITPMQNMAEFFEQNNQYNLTNLNHFDKLLAIYKKTFIEMVRKAEDEGNETIEDIFETLGEHLELGIIVDDSINAHAEEVVEGSVSLVSGEKVTFNGEVIFNAIYGIMDNIPGLDTTEFKKYFVHEGIYPEFTFSLPVGVTGKVGVSDVIEVGLKASLSAYLFKGTMKIKNLFENNKPGISVAVNLSADNTNITSNEKLSLKCNVITSDGADYDTLWYIGGKEVKESIDSNGNLNVNNKSIAHIYNISQNLMQIESFAVGSYPVTCYAKTASGNQSFDSIQINVK